MNINKIKDIDKIIEDTVNLTITKLKLSGLMKDNRPTAYQKTEEILKNYNDFLKGYSQNELSNKFVDIVDQALNDIRDDPYYDIIPMTYFEGQTREKIAEYFDTSVRTITRNKTRLINRLKILIFSDEVIYELFL